MTNRLWLVVSGMPRGENPRGIVVLARKAEFEARRAERQNGEQRRYFPGEAEPEGELFPGRA